MQEHIDVTMFIASNNPRIITPIVFRVLAHYGMLPSSWGPEEVGQRSYNADALLEYIRAHGSDVLTIHLTRQMPVGYTGYLSISESGLSILHLRLNGIHALKYWKQVRILCDALAAQLYVEYGFLHRLYHLGHESQQYDEAAILAADEYQLYGLTVPCICTWYGALLCDLMGREHLMQAPAYEVRQQAWGGIAIQTVPDIADAAFDDAFTAQSLLYDYLLPSGLFADYSVIFYPQRAARWNMYCAALSQMLMGDALAQ